MWLFRSPLVVLGSVLGLFSAFFHLVLLLLHMGSQTDNPYLDILFFFLLPGGLLLGVGMAWLGIRRTLWRRRREYEEKGEPVPPILPLSAAAVLVIGLVGLLVLGVTGASGYAVYHYSESVGFCGSACHTPMGPTYAAYQQSPHSEIECVACHVGDGPRGFIEAKVSGTVQLWETLWDSFPRPIVAPRSKMFVPAEACKRCHVPGSSSHFRLEFRTAIAGNESNTFRPLFMTLKTIGPRELIQPQNFHWHRSQIEYVSTDERDQEIPWVRVKDGKGSKVYRSDGLSSTADPPGEIHTMQCIDCHNRVGHHYRSADEVVNQLFSTGKLDYSLPHLKRESTGLMAASYDTTSQANEAIASGLQKFYESSHPETARNRSHEIEQQIETLVDAFRHNLFPEMKADWRAYPDHSGHWYSPGCFRCHDGKHVADDGSKIPNDCTLCHDFYEEREQDGSKIYIQGKYKHPWDLEKVDHAQYPCSSCHRGGPTPPEDCVECHQALSIAPPPR